MASYKAHYSEHEKRVFSKRLRQLMVDQGINGAELARKASQYREGEMPRQLISQYLNGTTIPDQVNLNALAKAFKIPAAYLLQKPQHLATGEVEVALPSEKQNVGYSMDDSGAMKLNIVATVPREIGQQIIALLQQAGH